MLRATWVGPSMPRGKSRAANHVRRHGAASNERWDGFSWIVSCVALCDLGLALVQMGQRGPAVVSPPNSSQRIVPTSPVVHPLGGAKSPSSPRDPLAHLLIALPFCNSPFVLTHNLLLIYLILHQQLSPQENAYLVLPVDLRHRAVTTRIVFTTSFIPLIPHHGFDHADSVPATRAGQAELPEQQCTSHRGTVPGALVSGRLPVQQRIDGSPDTTIASLDRHDAPSSMDTSLVCALPF